MAVITIFDEGASVEEPDEWTPEDRKFESWQLRNSADAMPTIRSESDDTSHNNRWSEAFEM
jgi:hypothetical protein